MLLAGRRTITERAILYARRHHHPSALSLRPFALTAGPRDTATLNLSSSDGLSNVEPEQRPSIATTNAKTQQQQQQQSPTREEDYASRVRREKYKDLLDSLNAKHTHANPDLTWTCYVDLLDITRDDPLPLEIHQRVLRSCAPAPEVMRGALVWRLAERQQVLRNPHPYEGRFLTIVSSIRRAGYVPSLEDYEFVLTHFTAVGHHIGAAQVLQEVMRIGLEPRTKTYNLCLQTLAFRLSLQCYKKEKEKLRDQCAKLGLHIAGLIRKRKQMIPSVCLDLLLRIMKDTNNVDVFKSLLKIAYGVDLDYLDRHPLPADGVDLGDPEPFSTAALTTLVDFLGRRSPVSKMIAAFEVLSTPLPINPADANLRNFDDDDDDYPVPTTSSPASRPLPSARPNTTTYNTLIRHLAQRRRTTFAKHYLLQALDLDYSASALLQSEIQTKPLHEVEPQRFRVNPDTFRPVYSLAGRDKDLGLLKWMLPHFRMACRRKRQDLDYYTAILENPDAPVPSPSYPRDPGGFYSEYGFSRPAAASQPQNTDGPSPTEAPRESSVTFFTPSAPSASPSSTSPTSQGQQPSPGCLDVSLVPASSATPPLRDQFDLALHVEILQRDVDELKKLDGRIGAALSRLHIRRKERLGRRIWAGKSIFLRTASGRVSITREKWMKIVNFGAGKQKKKKRLPSVEQPPPSAEGTNSCATS